jgi:hypothetical protein
MTKGEAKNLALRWLDEATINGQPVSSELTADLEDKFSYMLNGVLSYLATFFKVDKTYTTVIDAGVKKSRYRQFVMPDDFRGIKNIIAYDDSSYAEVENYVAEQDGVFLLPDNIKGTIEFNYFGEPMGVPVDADNSTQLEVAKKAEVLVPLKLAIDATAGSEETSALSAYLNSVFSNMLANIIQGETTAYKGVTRVYAM